VVVHLSLKEILGRPQQENLTVKTGVNAELGARVMSAQVRCYTWQRPLGRPRRRWEDNIKMDLLEVRCGGMDWIELAQNKDRWRTLVNAVMNLRVP